jgi:spermidine synthase
MIPMTDKCKAVFDPATLRLTFAYPGMGYWYQFNHTIEQVRSEFQDIRVMQHDQLGRVLLLDNDIMSAEDSTAYDDAVFELLSKFSKTKLIKRVLILGGGDCSLAARLQDLSHVDRIDLLEIDPIILDVCKRNFPFINQLGPKVRIHNENAFEAIKSGKFGPYGYDLVIDAMFADPHGGGKS